MKYYLVEISDGDSKIKGKGIYEFEKRNDAIANFHTKLGNAMKSDLFTREQIFVINSANGIEEHAIYEKEIEEGLEI